MLGKILSVRGGFVAVWLLAVSAGFLLILKYQNAPGRAGNTALQWPSAAAMTPDSSRDTLLMFAHPQCPCTRASMEELNRVLARIQGRLSVRVLFLRPHGFPASWARTDLWRSAEALPGVTVAEDLDGVQARLFGAETSGYVLLYDTHGRLLFHGGITGSRGHAGDNAGEQAVISLVLGRDEALKQTPVFGCSLTGECEFCTAETNQ